jgi:hypothetical protein
MAKFVCSLQIQQEASTAIEEFRTNQDKSSNIYKVPEALSPGVKRPEREVDHSPPPSGKVKNGGYIPPLPHMSSWHSD